MSSGSHLVYTVCARDWQMCVYLGFTGVPAQLLYSFFWCCHLVPKPPTSSPGGCWVNTLWRRRGCAETRHRLSLCRAVYSPRVSQPFSFTPSASRVLAWALRSVWSPLCSNSQQPAAGLFSPLVRCFFYAPPSDPSCRHEVNWAVSLAEMQSGRDSRLPAFERCLAASGPVCAHRCRLP